MCSLGPLSQYLSRQPSFAYTVVNHCFGSSHVSYITIPVEHLANRFIAAAALAAKSSLAIRGGQYHPAPDDVGRAGLGGFVGRAPTRVHMAHISHAFYTS